MQLENRYLAIKRKDLEKHLNALEQHILYKLADKVAQERRKEGRREFFGLFIEDDWPEYQPTLAALSKRVDTENK